MTPPRGYTLLEMLVVIGVIALASALVAPASYRTLRSWQDAAEVKQVLQDLSRLPMAARRLGQPIEIGKGSYTGELDALPLPEGWTLQLAADLIVRANGACSGADATLDTGAQQIPLVMNPPYCRAQRRPEAAP